MYTVRVGVLEQGMHLTAVSEQLPQRCKCVIVCSVQLLLLSCQLLHQHSTTTHITIPTNIMVKMTAALLSNISSNLIRLSKCGITAQYRQHWQLAF